MSIRQDLSDWYNKMAGTSPRRHINNRFTKIVPKDVDKLEAKLGIVLPYTYRDFLLNSSGEPLFYDTCDVTLDDDENKTLYSFTIRKFIAKGSGGVDDLIKTFSNLKANLPERMLPIAFDRFRNIMCIELGTGKIYFWDMQSLVEESRRNPNRHNLYFVSNNFEKFIEKLYKQNKYL
jgi:hypothetical protein